MSGIQLLPETKDIKRIVWAIRQLLAGRSNSTGSVTLRASQTTTVVSAPNCSTDSEVFLSPRTSNAAGALATTYVLAADIKQGSFTITHASAVSTDRTFGWDCRG